MPWQSGQPTRVEEDRGEERIVRREETTERQEQVMVVEVKKEVLPVMQVMRPQLTERPEEDDWYILLEPPPKEIGTRIFSLTISGSVCLYYRMVERDRT